MFYLSARELVDGYYGDDHSNYVQNVPLRLTIENLAQELKDELDNCTAADYTLPLEPSAPHASSRHTRHDKDPPYYHEAVARYPPLNSQGRSHAPANYPGRHPHQGPVNHHTCHQGSSQSSAPSASAAGHTGSGHTGSGASAATARTNEEILNALRKIIERYERDDSEEEMMYEWRQVALAVDRILFWIFFIGTLSSTILILIVAPITKFM